MSHPVPILVPSALYHRYIEFLSQETKETKKFDISHPELKGTPFTPEYSGNPVVEDTPANRAYLASKKLHYVIAIEFSIYVK